MHFATQYYIIIISHTSCPVNVYYISHRMHNWLDISNFWFHMFPYLVMIRGISEILF